MVCAPMREYLDTIQAQHFRKRWQEVSSSLPHAGSQYRLMAALISGNLHWDKLLIALALGELAAQTKAKGKGMHL